MRLPLELVAAGDLLVHRETIDSTMEEARRRFAPGLARRIWIVADRQEAGRGRSGRTWVSPPGNLHMTLLAPVALPLRDQPKLGFAAGVALAGAAGSLLPEAVDVRLKWPNDLLLNGAKASGILLEGLGGGEAVAIGIGVNVTAHPVDLPYAATHLHAHAPDIDRQMLFERLAPSLVAEIDRFATEGFASTRSRWLSCAVHLGQMIAVRREPGRVEGRFVDLDDHGRLLLETPSGLRPIEAGDVFPLDKAAAGGQGLGGQA